MQQTVRVTAAKDFGLALQVARTAHGLTQQAAADRMHVDRSYLSRLESGNTTLQLERIMQMLRRLGAEVQVVIPNATDAQAPAPEAATPEPGVH